MKAAPKLQLSDRDIAFWRAYIEILSERVPLVYQWGEGLTTWHPRVVKKILWYSGTRNTKQNRHIVLDWLMGNVAVYTDEETQKKN